MKKFFEEFKNFATRGNVVDLAVGVIIGAAFQSIVNSLVNDIVSPLLGLFTRMDFSSLVLNIRDVPIKYGSFITAVINFVVMAFVVFLIVSVLNKIKSLGHTPKTADQKQTTKKCPYCISDIPYEAVRCPNCTSVLEDKNDK